jgi:hypothetical protein
VREDNHVPKFVSIVVIALGCIDIARGFIHTILLEFAATNIAGLDLSTALAGDLLQLMGTFGVSNYLTGAMLILIGWKARPLALAMLGIIPVAYVIGVIAIRANSAAHAPSQAAWGGARPMMVYLAVCAITFIVGVWITMRRRKRSATTWPSTLDF